jgi:hypothetical protein
MSPTEQMFADFVTLDECAAAIGRHKRTVKRWNAQPDGFPLARMGPDEFVHIPSGRAWLMRRVKGRNPRRVRGISSATTANS